MKNLEDLGLVHLDEVGDEKSFIVIVQDEIWVDVLQGTRSQIIEFISEVFEIEEDEFDSTREILEYCEDINGDGAPHVQIISPHHSFVSI